MNYKTIAEFSFDELIEKRSRFIGYAMPVINEQEAIDFINTIKKKHSDARHNVYAYSLIDGQTRRYSDDGEPQGTAGVPVLEVILREELVNIVIVVTRYFGGTLLGTGGLVRAYSKVAKLALNSSKYIDKILCDYLNIEIDYNDYQKAMKMFDGLDVIIIKSDFAENVTLNIVVRQEHKEKLTDNLLEISCGKCKISKIFEEFYSF